MGDGWHPGDLALCIKAIDGLGVGDGVRSGSIHTVAALVWWDGDLFLTFTDLNHGWAKGYWARCFRRIAPLTEAEHRQAVEEMLAGDVLAYERLIVERGDA